MRKRWHGRRRRVRRALLGENTTLRTFNSVWTAVC